MPHSSLIGQLFERGYHTIGPYFAGLADKALADRALHIFVTTYDCDIHTAVSQALSARLPSGAVPECSAGAASSRFTRCAAGKPGGTHFGAGIVAASALTVTT